MQVQIVIVQDSPDAAIVRFAEKEKIDLIAMGSRNRDLVEGLLLGLGECLQLCNPECQVSGSGYQGLSGQFNFAARSIRTCEENKAFIEEAIE